MVIGIVAHVDAGKTTLSESILYTAGSIRRFGRVDKGDAFLDNTELERERGITIVNKQARFQWKQQAFTLVDTPGHVDFSAEMERTLQILDYAILVVSAVDGVQGHTVTLWKLLQEYQIPVFIFVNKMDQDGARRETVLQKLHEQLSDVIIDMTSWESEECQEQLALCDEEMMECFLQGEEQSIDRVQQIIRDRKMFPCYMGAALRNQGVEQLLDGLEQFTMQPAGHSEFGARVFQVERDEKGNRLTHVRITGGAVAVKDMIGEEKVNELRLYSGAGYQTVGQLKTGEVGTIVGLSLSTPGQGLGIETNRMTPHLQPAFSYRVSLPPEISVHEALPKFKVLEEENPELAVEWNSQMEEIQIKLMGPVQIEVLIKKIEERFGFRVTMDQGSVVYHETIADTVEGVGHYEPLRHYAEVHLLMEPAELGSGIHLATDCSEDELDLNWQRLIMSHLQEREIRGVLVGAPLTDAIITLIAGRAHLKHTEGGDFRQATYRALRQGLMQATTVLLEPFYTFQLRVLSDSVGRAMNDLSRMSAESVELVESENGWALLTGLAPVVTMQNYASEVAAYTHGRGSLFCQVECYKRCHNIDEIVAEKAYLPDEDADYPSSSVFCAHGAGFLVPWNKVTEYMHLEGRKQTDATEEQAEIKEKGHQEETWLGVDEIDQILARTYNANKRSSDFRQHWARYHSSVEPLKVVTKGKKSQERLEEYLLVDGYNVIHAWEELRDLVADNMDGARGKLNDILCNYQAIRGMQIIVVYDAYRVKGHKTECLDYHNIHVVYTQEAETADQYIERFAHDNNKKYRVSVATSDGLEQVIIRGNGCYLLSAGDLWNEIVYSMNQLRDEYMKQD